VTAKSTGPGTGGNLSIDHDGSPVKAVSVSGGGSTLSVEATGGGNAGHVDIRTSDLDISKQAKITAKSKSGKSGDVRISGLSSLRISDNSAITAETESGKAGNVIIAKSIDSNGNPSAPAGNVLISGSDKNRNQDPSLVAVKAISSGKAGVVKINADSLTITAGGRITAENISDLRKDDHGNPIEKSIELNITGGLNVNKDGVITATTGNGRGGNIDINANELMISNGGQITASSTTGEAGNVIVRNGSTPLSAISISGSGSRLAVEATEVGGNAGVVQLNTQNLTISDQGKITAENVSQNEEMQMAMKSWPASN
jgi:large exoprotein involved in heme utilization and adhesion